MKVQGLARMQDWHTRKRVSIMKPRSHVSIYS